MTSLRSVDKSDGGFGSVGTGGAGGVGAVRILAAYICRPCEIEGRDAEVSPGEVLCWNCGVPALITARVAG